MLFCKIISGLCLLFAFAVTEETEDENRHVDDGFRGGHLNDSSDSNHSWSDLDSDRLFERNDSINGHSEEVDFSQQNDSSSEERHHHRDSNDTGRNSDSDSDSEETDTVPLVQAHFDFNRQGNDFIDPYSRDRRNDSFDKNSSFEFGRDSRDSGRNDSDSEDTIDRDRDHFSRGRRNDSFDGNRSSEVDDGRSRNDHFFNDSHGHEDHKRNYSRDDDNEKYSDLNDTSRDHDGNYSRDDDDDSLDANDVGVGAGFEGGDVAVITVDDEADTESDTRKMHQEYRSHKTRTSSSYVATFDDSNNGISGEIKITAGHIFINLDFGNVNDSVLPNEDCLTNLQYHVHSEWNHQDLTDKIGSDDCGSEYTSGHYDPTQACGSASSNIQCLHKDGCISSDDYDCNPDNFALNPYACEVGDWSGKYGFVNISNDSVLLVNERSFWEFSGPDVENMSVVFHCGNTGARAFCAPIQKVTTEYQRNSFSRWPQQSSEHAPNGVTVDFGQNGKIFMDDDNKFRLGTDLRVVNKTCGEMNLLQYAIFNEWNSNSAMLTGTDCSSIVIGSAWDPTNQCPNQWSDSSYCVDSRLCNDTAYSYSCEERFCAPGALSFIYGPVSSNSATFYSANKPYGSLPPFDLILNKSIAFYCNEDLSFAMCAPITAQRKHRTRGH